MSAIRGPFGPEKRPSYSPRPLTILAQPGQEIRVIVGDESGNFTSTAPDSSRGSPSPSPDSSRGSPSPKPDRGRGGAFGPPAGTTAPAPATVRVLRSPPLTFLAQPGQEIRIIVPEPGQYGSARDIADSSRGSPSPGT